ncbi:phosphoribosyltransferase [Arthrobacter sp. 7749]|nr:phosphoribosyltransferase [Arthrobacter sp. 7749]
MGKHAGLHFQDRAQAGTALGEVLAAQGVNRSCVVLGLLRGGVPVAAALAQRLDAELGALAVRKLGVPGQQELAFGAIATYGSAHGRYLVPRVYRQALELVPATNLRGVETRAALELERLAKLFASFAPDLTGRTVVLCDDGLATGATMRAALDVVAQYGAREVITAVPVAPSNLIHPLAGASAATVLISPPDFSSVGAHYADFSQVTEEEVLQLLRTARETRHAGGPRS